MHTRTEGDRGASARTTGERNHTSDAHGSHGHRVRRRGTKSFHQVQTDKAGCGVWWREMCAETPKKHRDVADLGAGDSDGRACPRDQRPVVGKEGGGPGCDPGGGGRGGEGKALQPDTAASTWLEHLSDTES